MVKVDLCFQPSLRIYSSEQVTNILENRLDQTALFVLNILEQITIVTKHGNSQSKNLDAVLGRFQTKLY